MNRLKKIVCVSMACVMTAFLLVGFEGLGAVTAKAASSNEVVNSVDTMTEDQAAEILAEAMIYSQKAEDTNELITIMAEMGYDKATLKKAFQVFSSSFKSKKEAILQLSEMIGMNDITKIYNDLYKAVVGSTKAKGGKISKMDIIVVEEQLYSGKAIKPSVTVMDGGYELKKGKDYKITYSNNKKIGKAVITMKGLGKYTGTVKKKFSIVAIKTSDIPTSYITMAELVNKNVHLTWRGLSKDKCDEIQILRSKTQDGKYSVIHTITKTDKAGDYYSGYIDTTAKGKTYYYAVRAVVKVKGKKYAGEIDNKIKAEKTNYKWYKGDTGYIKVTETSDNTLDGFVEYDTNGTIIWNCDWPVSSTEEEATWVAIEDGKDVSYTKPVNYSLSTPGEYYENGQSVNVNVYYGKDEFYYIWAQDGHGFIASFDKYN
ncbi:MAG: hypothetical protein ACERKN_18520 [Velocimicrobium sp.]